MECPPLTEEQAEALVEERSRGRWVRFVSVRGRAAELVLMQLGKEKQLRIWHGEHRKIVMGLAGDDIA
jgi:hypothetical protein